MPTIAYPPKRIQDGLGFLVNHLSYELRHAIAGRCHRVGYNASPESLGILFLLSREEGLTQRDITEFLAKDKATITRLLNTLEKERLVTRRQDESDRRVTRIYLTKEGRKSIDMVIPTFTSLFEEIYEGLDPDDYDTARRVLSTVIDNLHKQSGEHI